ncbi:MAG: MurR/RpiR family transcriptional regulator [Leucobacter sp.]
MNEKTKPYDRSVPLLEHLIERRGTLRRSELKVADLIADDPRAVVNSTMAGVAAAAGVSEPTVMRFATSLGFDGFQQFRMALAESLVLGLPATLSTVESGDSVAAITEKIFDHTMTSLDRARRYLDPEQSERAVEVLLECTSILFIGQGASGIIAEDAAQKAALFGLPCAALQDSHQQFMAASMSGPGTVIVAISNTGETKSVLEIARLAKERGCKLISIVGVSESTLGSIVDIPIVVRTFENTDIFTPSVSRLAALVAVDILATAVAVRRGSQHSEELSRMKDELSAFRRE